MSSPKPSHAQWGGSPGGGGGKDKSSVDKALLKQARSYLAKVRYGGVDVEEVVVGFAQATNVSKSGAAKWSARVRYEPVELPLAEFLARFPTEDDIPYHQVIYFLEGGETVLTLGGGGAFASDLANASCAPLREEEGADGEEGGEATPGASSAEATEAVPCVADLVPRHCWHQILSHLDVKDIMVLSGTCGWLDKLCKDGEVWEGVHASVYDVPPKPLKPGGALNPLWVRQLCLRSEMELSRWQQGKRCARSGPAQADGVASFVWLDSSKAVTASEGTLTVWMHWDPATGDGGICGKKIATLQAHTTSTISALACNAATMLTACTKGVLKVWSMDELRCVKSYRVGAAEAVVATSALTLPGGLCVTASDSEELVKVWDPGLDQAAPVLSLSADASVSALTSDFPDGSHHVYSGGQMLQQWDLETAQEVQTLSLAYADSLSTDFVGPDSLFVSELAFSKGLLAVAQKSIVALFDVRMQLPAVRCRLGWGASFPPSSTPEVHGGLHIDGWKVMTGAVTSPLTEPMEVDGTQCASALFVYDIRWCSASGTVRERLAMPYRWSVSVLYDLLISVLKHIIHPTSNCSESRSCTAKHASFNRIVVGLEGTLKRFGCHEHSVVASMEQGPCQVYRFEATRAAAEAALSADVQVDLRRLGRAKGDKTPKRNNNNRRYPKRRYA